MVERRAAVVLLRDLCPRDRLTGPSVLASTPVCLARSRVIRSGASGVSPTALSGLHGMWWH